jgi:xanthosine utilization system XapX-like protein
MTMPRLPSTASAQPFNIVAVLLYPAQMPSLTTLVALSLGMLFTPAPVLGFVALLVIWAAACRYCVEVVERSANGSLVAPEFAFEPDGIGWTLLLLQALLMVCGMWLDYRVESAGLRWFLIGVLACLQPAMILTTVMIRDIGSAFSPARLLRVLDRFGTSYVLLVVATFMLGMVQLLIVATNVLSPVAAAIGTMMIFVGAEMAHWLSIVLGQMLSGFVWFYLMVMYFHLLGRMVYMYREEFDFTPVPESILRPEDRHAPLLQRVDRLVEVGNVAQAAHELGRSLATELHVSPAMHARYRTLLSRLDDRPALQAHARDRLAQLMATGAEREAMSLLRESLARDPLFQPASGELTTQLGRAAERLGQFDLALAMLQDFMARNPRDMDGAANALIASRILLERRSDTAGARIVLQTALDHFLPAHPEHGELVRRIAQLDLLSRRMPDQPTAAAARNP